MISAKRMLFVAEKVLLSEIVLSRRNTESVIKNVNKKVAALCKKKKRFVFISNGNISCFNF